MSTLVQNNQNRVDENTHKDLEWKDRPRGTWLSWEMVCSDAFRSLTKIESEIWLFVQLRKIYPKSKKALMKHWRPSNRDNLTIPEVAISDFFNGPARGMKAIAPSKDSIRKSFMKFMAVGFLSLKHQGGNGKGDMSIYRLENNWRLWKLGDPPCFTRAGMSREKGFCSPGSGVFNKLPRHQDNIRGVSTSD